MSNSVRPHRRQPTSSPMPGILQARTLEWAAISFSNTWKWKVKVKSLSRVRLYRPHGLQPTRLLRPWDFLGKSTGVGCHCLLQFRSLQCIRVPCAVQYSLISYLFYTKDQWSMCSFQSPNSFHPNHFPPWYPYICSLCLHLPLANKIIYPIFLDFTYMLIYDICF